MIQITNVTKCYGRRIALDRVSLTLHPGEVTLLLGANGAGKSTLLRCVLGLTNFDGEIRVAGRDPRREGSTVRALIGYMPQTGGLHTDLTVAETMTLYADIRSAATERCGRLIEEAGLAEHASTLVGELSGGMRQRLGFALALLTDPQILVLDEPSASLDASSRAWLAERLAAVAAEGRTVLVSTHAGQELLNAGHRRIMIEDGRVIAETSPAAGVRLVPRAGTPAAPVLGRIRPLIRKEIRDAVGNRWLVGYAALLGALGLAATATGLESTSGLALQAFGRTTATLMNLCLLLSPLVAVLMGAGAIAGENDRGTLEHLLAQPLTRTALLLGKHVGLLTALTLATVAGFVPAGVLIGVTAGPGLIAHYLLFPAIASLAGAAMAAVGLFISVSSRSAVQAQGTAVFAWFGFVLLYDLLLMGSLAANGMPAEWLAGMLIANPVDAARVLGVLALEPDLYLLGPAGAFIASRLSHTGAVLVLLTALVAWAALPVAAAVATFSLPVRRRGRAARAVKSQPLTSSEEVTFS